MDRRPQGVLLITLSAIAFSSAGFFTRLIHLDAWTLLFWRGVFGGLLILGIIVAQQRRRSVAAMRAVGRAGLLAAFCSTTATILYINALQYTSVADVAVLFATAPLVTAGVGRVWLGVSATWTALAASFIALLGVSIMVGGAVADGHLIGDLLALGMTICLAIMLLIIRQHQATPMLPAALLSALLCLLVWPFTAPLAIAADDMFNLLLFGTMQFGLGLVFLTLGGRWISATENALIGTMEAPLAVAWVWLSFGEAPSITSLVGGLVVVAAVVAHVSYSNRPRLAFPATRRTRQESQR